MGTVLLLAVLIATGRAVVWAHQVWVLVAPAAILVAAFFWYPPAPRGRLFIANMLWFG